MADRLVKIVLRGDVAGLKASMASASASVQGVADRMTAAERSSAKWRAGLSTVGDTAGKMGLAAAGGLALVTKAAMDWESAWAGVQKTVDGSASQMATLEGELRNLAKTLPASHQEIAAVAEAAGQLGVQRENVAGFTKTMIDLGETTNLTADEAATSIARFANIMGTAQGDVDQVGSALVELGNNSETTEAEILGLGQRLAAAGSIAGLSEGDVLGFAAALTSVGVEAEAGGTALSKVFTATRDAVLDGSEALDVFARTAGMSADEFAASFNADPAQAVDSFIQGLGRMNASGQSTTAVFEELELTDQRLMRALLSTAQAGDLLGESLDLGNTGFAENTALAIEAAKRYETSASQMQVSWNNIKDAAIGFGEVALPVLAGVAEKAAAAAQAIGSLPAPVKTAGVSLAGITAILGGGLWFTAKTIGAVSNMRTALTDLGWSGDKASKALRGVGTAAAVVAGASIVDSLQKQADDALPGLEAITKQLITLSETAAAGAMSSEFDSLGESIDRLADRNVAQKLQDSIYSAAPFLGSDSAVDAAKGEIEALDAALANLVSTGNAELAADAIENLGRVQGLSKSEMSSLMGLLPGYEEALTGQENAADLAAGSTNDFAAASDSAAASTNKAAEAVEAATEAMREQRSEVLRGLNAQINYQASLDDARKALRENGRGLDITTEKGRANKSALLGVAEAWNEQSAAAKNAPGAHRAAIKSFVDLAQKMGMGEDKARALAKRILELPDKKVQVTADTSQAENAIAGIGRSLINLDGRTARTYVTTMYNDVYNRDASGGIQRRAGGGFIEGPGTTTSDSIPAYLSNGEYVVRAAAVAKYGVAMFDRMNAMRFADGGLVEPQHFAGGGGVSRRDVRGFDLSGDLGVRGVRRELAEFRRAIRESGGEWTKRMGKMADRVVKVTRSYQRHEKQLDRATDRRQDLRRNRSALSSSAASVFDNDLFGGGTLDSVFLQLAADRNDARSQKKLLKNAEKLGVNNNALALLAQTNDLAALGDIDTKAEARRLNRLLAQRTAAQQAVGQFAGNEVFGQAIKRQNRTIDRLNRQMDRQDKTLNRLEEAVERGARRGIGDRDRHGRQKRRAG